MQMDGPTNTEYQMKYILHKENELETLNAQIGG